MCVLWYGRIAGMAGDRFTRRNALKLAGSSRILALLQRLTMDPFFHCLNRYTLGVVGVVSALGIKNKRLKAGWSTDYLTHLLGGQAGKF